MPSNLKLMKKLALHWKILIALTLGVLWAILSTVLQWNSFTINYISPWGTIFINLLKLIAIPLVLFSVIKGMMDLKDVGRLGRMGLKTLGAYLITTVFAVCLGLLAVNALKPGNAINQEQRVVNRMSYEIWLNETKQPTHDGMNFLDKPEYADLKELASARLTELNDSELVQNNATKVQAVKKTGPLQFLVDMVPSNIFLALNDTLMLQVIFFAIFFGVTLVLIPADKASPVNAFVDGMNEVFLKMVDIIMRAAPYFVFCLMAGKMVEMAGTSLSAMVEVFKGLGAYMVVVIIALATMIIIVYPLLFALLAGRKRGFTVIESYIYTCSVESGQLNCLHFQPVQAPPPFP